MNIQKQNRTRSKNADEKDKLNNQAFTVAGCLMASITLLTSVARGGSVSFQFEGVVDAVSGSGAVYLPTSVATGTPVFGEVHYKSSDAGPDLQPAPEAGIYPFGPATLALTMKIGTNSFESDPNVVNYITVYNDASGSPTSDRILYSASGVFSGGSPLAGNPDSSYWNIDFSTTNLAALNSDALPTNAPSLSDFVKVGGYGYRQVSCFTYKNGDYYYGFSAQITSVSPIPELQVIRQGANCIVLWPATAQYGLETATNIAGPWTPSQAQVSETNSVRSINAPATEQRRFYRLVKTQGKM